MNARAAEAFVDYAGRQWVDKSAEHVVCYGAKRVFAESPLPRISAARHLPQALRRRLGVGAFAARSA